MKKEPIGETKGFYDFYKSATAYCEILEMHKDESTVALFKLIRNGLLYLYANALELDWIELKPNMGHEKTLDEKYFETMLRSVENTIGGSRYYWHVFDPTNHDETEPLCGDLVDDLGDIYKDLKCSILLFNMEKEYCRENALWQFKFDFENHWGDHCINALHGIHFHLQNERT